MHSFDKAFEIVDDNNCPLYEAGERFRLTDRAFAPPERKQACLILMREITELLFVLMNPEEGQKILPDTGCYSCSGLIKFKHTVEDGAEATLDEAETTQQQGLLDKITRCGLFREIAPAQLKQLVPRFKEMRIRKGRTLLRKGEPNRTIYVILSGELSVDDGPVHLARLGAGDLCGEMSYFVGASAGATVTAHTDVHVVGITGELYHRLVESAPSIQSSMVQLLAKRLLLANKARFLDFDSSMQGSLSDMSTAELFQILHMHQKTGELAFSFGGQYGQVIFREGCIINASYGRLSNQDAIYGIIAERRGSYTFRSGLEPAQMRASEIGDFNALLMEGIQRIDEAMEHKRE
jgi:CRP-like cAMP-binding protein